MVPPEPQDPPRKQTGQETALPLRPKAPQAGRSVNALAALYTPLQPWETRLLSLLPGKGSMELSAKLQIAVITYEEGLGLVDERHNIRYEALSYTWGEVRATHTLWCNGIKMGITTSLAEALGHLRLPDKPRYLWVDALCINQTDDVEKARQIRNLKLIFGRARRVVAWLGPAGTNTKAAADFLKHIRSDVPTETEVVDALYETGDSFPNEFHADERVIPGLSQLASSKWYSRAWIVQECYAARSIVVQSGLDVLEWSSFSRLPALLKILLDRRLPRSQVASTEPLKFLISIACSAGKGIVVKRGYQEPAGELYQLLCDTTHLNATDDRDRIFALLGLTNVPTFYGRTRATKDDGIHVDYSKTTAEVYAEVSKYLYCYMPNSLLLMLHRLPAADLPSWCLDFRNPRYPDQESLSFWPSLSYPITTEHQPEQDVLLYIDACVIGTVTGIYGSTNSSILRHKFPSSSIAAPVQDLKQGPASCVDVVLQDRVQEWVADRWSRSNISIQLDSSAGRTTVNIQKSIWLTSGKAQLGDQVVMLTHGSIPLLLRKRNSSHRLIGFATVYESFPYAAKDPNRPHFEVNPKFTNGFPRELSILYSLLPPWLENDSDSRREKGGEDCERFYLC